MQKSMSGSWLALDVRQLDPSELHLEILAAFDALGPGDAFVLVSDCDPRPLLLQFQAKRPMQFDWVPLETGPEQFRVEIRRRTSSGPRSVTEYLEDEHQRLQTLLDEIERLVDARAFGEARAVLAELACGLGHHIDSEHNLIFPVFEAVTGGESWPTERLRAEHEQIVRLVQAVALNIVRRDARSADLVRVLGGFFSAHCAKEERVLYPLTDRAACDDRERHAIVARIQAM